MSLQVRLRTTQESGSTTRICLDCLTLRSSNAGKSNSGHPRRGGCPPVSLKNRLPPPSSILDRKRGGKTSWRPPDSLRPSSHNSTQRDHTPDPAHIALLTANRNCAGMGSRDFRRFAATEGFTPLSCDREKPVSERLVGSQRPLKDVERDREKDWGNTEKALKS